MDHKQEVNINDERSVRLQKLKELGEMGINAYPARVTRTHQVADALREPHDTVVTLAGRIMTKREMGKLTFFHLEDESGRMQVVIKKDDIGEELYKLFVKKIDSGDIIEITGERFITQKGEESVLSKSFVLLTKALLPLPDKFYGLENEELKMRKRYLDFLVNRESKEKIIVRSKLVRALREFMYEKNFIEVETPMLETVASGALAKTFDTHYNAFDMPVHLRIAIEIPQKRMLVGGFEKIFEIGRCFRNEGVDHQHNPEFTQIEYYWAYADYEDNMKLHEEMLPRIIAEAIGSTTIDLAGNTIEFRAPYKRTTFREVVLEHSGIDLNIHDTKEKLATIMKQEGYEVDPKAGFGRLADDLWKASARPKVIQPTFVLNYPAELKPLAKKADDPRYTEVFQLVVNGFEVSNSYTELNDPIDQKERFEEQAENKKAGDDEAMEFDADFIEALEHGMPPSTGTGIGIDRLAALITGSHSLKEVIVFPTVKPLESQKSKQKSSK
jgi:lysyl-tRNA synthetase class 2